MSDPNHIPNQAETNFKRLLAMEKQERLHELRALNTRHLMALLSRSRGDSGHCNYLHNEVKEILRRRPHVPNKIEAKALRRAKAQGRA